MKAGRQGGGAGIGVGRTSRLVCLGDVLLAMILSLGCPSSSVPMTNETSMASGDATSTDPGGSGVETGAASSTGSTAPSSFLARPDQGDISTDCDLWMQNCAANEKCMPWANDGSAAWNSTVCSPIVADPVGEGDACTVVGSATSGVDDCGLGLMCWNVDENGSGYCEDMCLGSADNPICDDPHEVCLLSGAPFALCVDGCDPLLQDCPDEHHACHPYGTDWICVADASGGLGAHGDACEYISACDEGLVCVGAAALSDCASSVGCCSAICRVDDASADATCAALDPAQVCIPWYQPGLAPSGDADVGVCALPG